MTTRKQQEFEWDFTCGVDRYEAWDEIRVGEQGAGARTFTVCEEDILAFNLSALETDPLLTDPSYAAQHGGLVQHPLFVVQVAFYCVDTGIGSWIRSPGARNPGQSIELFEPFRPCEEITATITHWDKWFRRDNHYMVRPPRGRHSVAMRFGVERISVWRRPGYRSANRRAVARPIPLAAPVTTMTRSAIERLSFENLLAVVVNASRARSVA